MPPDLNKLLRTGKFHIDELSREANISKQWLLENSNAAGDHPISADNHLEFFICASNAFPQIVKDIEAAQKSVDLICWGFDPGMEIGERQGGKWPRGLTYGDLLSRVAARGITVRLLVWYPAGIGKRLGLMANNLPGYTNRDTLQRVVTAFADKKNPDLANYYAAFHQTPDRARYCLDWWKKAMAGQFPDLHIRHRCPGAQDVGRHLQGETAGFTPTEIGGLKEVATHHQKPILIDFDLPGPQSVGYVMGLNSTTDYWDTPEHVYDNPLRGYGWEGTADSTRHGLHLKPYRDYAIRVQGRALHCLNRNFAAAWDRAERNWNPKAEVGSLAWARQAFTAGQFAPPAGKARHIAQIIRTQPEENDKTIQDAYWLATSQARNYIYIENQYFQHTPWAEHLKAMRQKYALGMQRAGANLPIPNLYVFIVMPEPEQGGMVPRTYDTVAELGQGGVIPKYDGDVQKFREAPQRERDSMIGRLAQSVMQLHPATLLRQHLTESDIADSANRPPVSGADLEALGIKVLIAKLYTQGEKGRCREIYIHSKLTIIDDAFFTLGSANLNLRSMAGDSEINIACMDKALPREMRQQVWANLAGEDLDGGEGNGTSIKDTHKLWIKKMKTNAKTVEYGNDRLQNHIVTFSDSRGATGLGIRLAQAAAAADDRKVATA
ncbi:phospholipase D-like domain-containing protein [Collimonas antrihumi]|uniref:phospholipase D-like domain-containing protein n=1 Tax=Collimonas antrihumi TaxID=1940615 RepID=UPI001B8C6637|nr:phospholipase D-like domain-containing protein [Collimonas antrihumi]